MNCVINKIKNANIILEKGPAAYIESCCFLFFFFNIFSSGSTNAANIGPRNAKPDAFILTLWSLANIPWENSWITATIKIAIIQCQKLNTGSPGIETPVKLEQLLVMLLEQILILEFLLLRYKKLKTFL